MIVQRSCAGGFHGHGVEEVADVSLQQRCDVLAIRIQQPGLTAFGVASDAVDHVESQKTARLV